MSISRALSWPLLGTTGRRCTQEPPKNLVEEKVKGDDKKDESIPKQKSPRGNVSPQVQARKLLCRHYYPEGGWGWVIAVVGTLVHLLGSGVQLSVPATLTLPATIKFHHQPLHTAAWWHIESSVLREENMCMTHRNPVHWVSTVARAGLPSNAIEIILELPRKVQSKIPMLDMECCVDALVASNIYIDKHAMTYSPQEESAQQMMKGQLVVVDHWRYVRTQCEEEQKCDGGWKEEIVIIP